VEELLLWALSFAQGLAEPVEVVLQAHVLPSKYGIKNINTRLIRPSYKKH
jgi:hypothetical protein